MDNIFMQYAKQNYIDIIGDYLILIFDYIYNTFYEYRIGIIITI